MQTIVAAPLPRDRIESPTFRAPFLVVDDFLPDKLADELRRGIDRHFADPNIHKARTHQVWNYWFVPALYTYLRTSPEKLIELEAVNEFVKRLGNWSTNRLGLPKVSWPYLSLYVPG